MVCFIGKIAFNTFYNSRKCDCGWQTEIGGARVYLMLFQSGALRRSARERVGRSETSHWRVLQSLVPLAFYIRGARIRYICKGANG